MGFFKPTWVKVCTAMILVLAVVVAEVYLRGSRKNQPISQSPPLSRPSTIIQPTLILHPTSVDQASLTATWKAYTNTKYSYAIKYPKSYAPYGFDSNGPTSNVNVSLIMFLEAPPPSTWNDPLPSVLMIQAMNYDEFKREKQNLDDAANMKKPCAGCPNKYIISINDTPATVYDGYGGYSINKVVLVEHGGRFYELSYAYGTNYDTSISDLMIDTLRFL